MKEVKFKVFVATVVIACTITVIGRITSLNLRYPNPNIISVEQNEPVKGGDIEIKVVKSSFLDMDDAMKIGQLFENDMMDMKGKKLGNAGKKILLVEIEIINKGDTVQPFQCTNFVAQSGAWANGWDLSSFLAINSLKTPYISVKAFEEETLQLPFFLYKIQFKDGEFEALEKRKYSLVLATYPEKRIVKLNPDL